MGGTSGTSLVYDTKMRVNVSSAESKSECVSPPITGLDSGGETGAGWISFSCSSVFGEHEPMSAMGEMESDGRSGVAGPFVSEKRGWIGGILSPPG